jgi:dolichol-phosphate mannosyltransferase
MLLTIIIPIFNEENTIEIIFKKILEQNQIKKQIILVDDFSTDKTREILKGEIFQNVDKIIYHTKNMGKGAAIRSATEFVKGDIVIIQDADLEYSPNDYSDLIKPIINNNFKVVYGSRVLNKKRYKSNNFTSLSRIFFNHFLTIFSNLLNNQELTDAHTCYKVFHTEIFNKLNLEEDDFAFCPEVTSKISKMKIKIHEVPISYNGRTHDEGKKISFYDGLRALYVLFKYRFH